MPQRRHRPALDQLNIARAFGPVRDAREWKFRPPAEPARHRRKAMLEPAPRPALGADMIDQNDLAARLRHARELVNVASGLGTAVMTYCATTTSKT